MLKDVNQMDIKIVYHYKLYLLHENNKSICVVSVFY